MLKKESKAERVHEVFQTIAGGYDLANDRISLGLQRSWKRMLTKRIAEQAPKGARILDVCCGTGDIALTIAQDRRDLPIIGIDFSDAMLKVARAKRDKEKRNQIMFLEGDAMHLPFEDDSFTVAVISFGLRNTSDYLQVIREMKRVVKKGGCIYCIDSFVPENLMVRPFYRLYFHKIMPFLGGGRKYNREYQWLSESTEHFLTPGQLMKLFQKAGLCHIRKKERMFGACVMIWAKVN